MASSPINDLENSAVLVKVKLDGKEMPGSYGIHSIKVHHAINRISTAELVLTADFEAETDFMQIADSDNFIPGKHIEIWAGYDGKQLSSLFKGIIVKHTFTFESNYRLVIDCRHEAVRMTYNETERLFQNQSDDYLIKNILSEYGLSCCVNSSSEVHEHMVQHMSTDWDFMVSRCHFNGSIVRMDDSTGIVIEPPAISTTAALTIEAGSSLISCAGSLDAGFQPSGVMASAWDPTTVSVMTASAAEPGLNSQGNITARDLSVAVPQAVLHVASAVPMQKESLQKWADGILLRRRLGALKGTAKFQGSALAKTGSIIEMKGVGKKLSGDAFVSEVTNTIESGNWTTEIAFGFNEYLTSDKPGIYNTPAMGQVPGMQGLQMATVKKIEQDPNNLSRILVEIPSLSGSPNLTWARMGQYYASNKSGCFFLPEIGDEVILGFLDNDPRYPVILGSVYNGKNQAPYNPTPTNDIKAIVTRSNLKIELDDGSKSIRLLTPGNGSIIMSDDGKSVEIKDQNGNCISLNAAGIRMDSAKDIVINANGNIALTATGKVDVTAKQDLSLSGLNINADADAALTAKGSATAGLSSGGQTTLKGAIVMIN